MSVNVNMSAQYQASPEIVAREIDGEIIIVPIVSGIGDLEDELFSLNETGKAIWHKLDGNKMLGDVVLELEKEFEAPTGVIKKDVVGLVTELLKRRMLVDASKQP